MSAVDTGAENIERRIKHHKDLAAAWQLLGFPATGALEDAALLFALRAERDAQQRRGDNHWETLRSIRQIARESGDLERIIQWVDDAGSGYTETAEKTLSEMTDRALNAEAERDAARREVGQRDEGLQDIIQWCEAYPVDVFIEPTKEKMAAAAKACEAVGLTFDALHASWARHILSGIERKARAALGAATEKQDG